MDTTKRQFSRSMSQSKMQEPLLEQTESEEHQEGEINMTENLASKDGGERERERERRYC